MIHSRESIARYLFKSVFGWYVIIALSVTLIQFSLEYSDTKQQIIEQMAKLPPSFRPVIAEALWTINPELLNSVLYGMSNIEIISGIEVYDTEEKLIQHVGITSKDYNQRLENFVGAVSYKFDITYEKNARNTSLGTCIIYSSSHVLVKKLGYRFLLVLINSIIKTTCLGLIFMFFINKILAKPLGKLANDIEKVDFYHLENSYVEVLTKGHNELKMLEKSFNQMIMQLIIDANKIQQITQTFKKFVPQQFLNRLAADGLENIDIGKAEADIITVMFSDIRNFTTMSEELTPQEVLNFINSFFRRMNEPINKNYGFIDKFIGDAIMAIFERKQDQQLLHPRDAVSAAIDMQRAVQEYNEHRGRSGYAPISIGVGLHTGEAIIGTVGSKDRMDSTVLGDTVNLTSRIEALTKFYGTEIIISSKTYRFLPENEFLTREIDFVNVKGKHKPQVIFEVFNANPPHVIDLKLKINSRFHEALVEYHSQHWDQAIQLFAECLVIYPDDNISKIYKNRCAYFRDNPPPKHWKGIFHIGEK